MINFPNRTWALYFRFAAIFVLTACAAFWTLNSRYVTADIEYTLGSIPAVTLIPQQQVPPQTSQIPAPNSAVPAQKPAQAPAETARLFIPKIGVNAPVVFGIAPKNKTILQNLQWGTVHYSATPKPGENGTAIILGHSSAYPWYRGKYGSVFALLNKLSVGDQFQITYPDGRIFTFAIKQSLVFNPLADDARLAQLEQSSSPAVVLISCWPVGTSYKRIAVRAELVH